MKAFFIFDVESIGLHGEGFAVGGGVWLANGAVQTTFCFCVDTREAHGFKTQDGKDREWVANNVPMIGETHRNLRTMRGAFWEEWIFAKSNYPDVMMAAECAWPVEARFLSDCIADEPKRLPDGPYPLLDISSIMLAAGMNPLDSYPREESEKPAHHPLTDATQSARLLSEALKKLKLFQT